MFARGFEEYCQVRMKLFFATSKRKDGGLDRARFFKKLKINPKQVVRAGLVHGARVAKVEKVPASGVIPSTDALVTNRKNIVLAISTADCFPVFFYMPDGTSVGIAHAGWRSVVKGVVPRTVKALQRYYKIDLQNLHVVIGPGIRKCHFEIKNDILKKFEPLTHVTITKKAQLYVDLPGIIHEQLVASGVKPKNIKDVKECTYHLKQKYFSYRRDRSATHPRGFGFMMSVVGING